MKTVIFVSFYDYKAIHFTFNCPNLQETQLVFILPNTNLSFLILNKPKKFL